MNLTVIGGGRVGLPVAAGLAQLGHQVICCEKDSRRRAVINSGCAPFADEGLHNAVAAAVASGALRVYADIEESVAAADAVFVAVPTKDGADGMDELYKAAQSAADYAPPRCVLVIKSTSPPGSCARIEKMLRRPMHLAVNPEFLRQGFGLRDFLSPLRIVVGVADKHSARVLRTVYARLIKRGVRYIEIGRAAAEAAKLTANMMLSSRAGLINEVADLCRACGANIDDVSEVLKSDVRIGETFLRPGIGFGGPCLPKDGRMLMESARRFNVDMPAVESLFADNAARPAKIAAEIMNLLPSEPVVAVWGFAFKPGADDICESPSAAVVNRLLMDGVRIHGYDSGVAVAGRKELPSVHWFDCPLDSLVGADMVVVLQSDKAVSRLPPSAIKSSLTGAVVFDYAGVFVRAEIEKAGLIFHALGGR